MYGPGPIGAVSIGEWTALIGALAALIAAVAGSWGIREYTLKSEAQRVEIDVQLSKLLAELVPIANGRGVPVISDSAAEAIAKAQLDRGADLQGMTDALEAAAITPVLGEATQASAITSIGYLGSEHRTLRAPAHQALQALEFVDDRPNLRPARRLALELVEKAQG